MKKESKKRKYEDKYQLTFYICKKKRAVLPNIKRKKGGEKKTKAIKKKCKKKRSTNVRFMLKESCVTKSKTKENGKK